MLPRLGQTGEFLRGSSTAAHWWVLDTHPCIKTRMVSEESAVTFTLRFGFPFWIYFKSGIVGMASLQSPLRNGEASMLCEQRIRQPRRGRDGPPSFRRVETCDD